MVIGIYIKAERALLFFYFPLSELPAGAKMFKLEFLTLAATSLVLVTGEALVPFRVPALLIQRCPNGFLL